MRLHRPSDAVFIIALILAVLALLSLVTPIPVVGVNRFWFMTAAYLVLALGTLMRGV